MMDGINPMAPWVVDAGREPMATHGFVNNRQVSNRGQQKHGRFARVLELACRTEDCHTVNIVDNIAKQ